ncbi:MAG: hypothetical protein ACRDRN_23295 [Sciscionella sp.]
MAEYQEPTETAEHTGNVARRRGPDLLALIAGLAAILASAYILTDGASWLPSIDPRWLLAGGALLVGVLMLASSMRSSHNG